MQTNGFHKADLHMHSTWSDGTDSPRELLDKVIAAGIDFFSITDHDEYRGGRELILQVKKRKQTEVMPYFISGAEFSCRDDLGKYHILGYAYDIKNEAVRKLMEAVHEVRIQKVTNRMRFLKERYGFHFSESEIASLMKHRNPGKPHIAKLMVRHRYAGTISEAILGFIDHYHGPERRIHPEEAIEAVIQGGGIPVLAHGPFGDGEQNLDKKEMTARVERLMNAGLMGLECYYSGFAEAHQDMMLELANRYHLLVTAGSDYHGENKLVRLGNTGRSDPAEINEQIRDFWVEAMKRGDSYSLN